MLIKSNSELRKHLGGAVSTSLGVEGESENDRILNFVPLAERKYVKKAIGKAVYDALLAEYVATAGVTEETQELFDCVQAAVAFYAYYEYLSFSPASDGDNGLEMDEKKAPKMWMVLERQNKAIELASDMIEEALKLLFEGNYADFKDSEEWSGVYGLLVNSGGVLRTALPPSGGSYRFFLTLWPYIAQIQERELGDIVGKATAADLVKYRSGVLDYARTESTAVRLTGASADLNDEQKGVFLKVRAKAESLVAYAAYAEALPQGLLVTVTSDGGLRVLTEFDGIRNRKAPKPDEMSQLLKSITDKRDRLRDELKAMMDEHRAIFPDYMANMYRDGDRPGFLDADRYNTIFPLR